MIDPHGSALNWHHDTIETVEQAGVGFLDYTQAGPRTIDFNMRSCLDRLTDEAIQVIDGMKDASQPQFLYFPFTAPHKPVLPSEEFAGTTKLGPCGDFLRQLDATVGRVINALESNGVLEQTLLIVTSDNDSFMYRLDEGTPDHAEDETVQGFRAELHMANADWRGTKADIWEAGHRMKQVHHNRNES